MIQGGVLEAPNEESAGGDQLLEELDWSCTCSIWDVHTLRWTGDGKGGRHHRGGQVGDSARPAGGPEGGT